MEKCVWKARVRDGMAEEYEKRHREIWPEMVGALKEAGVCRYSIFRSGNELFGYYECEKGSAYAAQSKAASKVFADWQEYMKDCMEPVEGQEPFRQVFYLD